MKNYYIHILFAFILISSQVMPANAQILWPTDGVAICNTTDVQEAPSLISDGSGGAIVVWANRTSGSDYNIYAQRIDASGNRMWTTGGIPVCTAVYDQSAPVIASDGAGGAIIAWQDGRSITGEMHIYAQRLSANGTVQWAANGIPVCIVTGDQFGPGIASDSQGGAFIAYKDTRSDPLTGSTDLYLQHIDSSGSTLASDVAIAASPLQDERDAVITSDGNGNAVIAWVDGRNTLTNGYEIYAQKISPSGSLLWGTSGLAVCTAAGDQRFPDVVPDGFGGVFICWDDRRNGLDYDIYAQHVGATGTPAWTANGSAVCTLASGQMVPTLQADGSGGAVVAWTDARAGSSLSSYDIYAQRINSSGTPVWTSGGVAVCSASGWQGRIRSAADGSGGVLFAWSDNRIDPTNKTYNYDVYSQSLNASGAAAWASNGIAACSANGRQELHRIIVSATGTAIVVWQDARVDTGKDIYGQKIGSSQPPILTVPSIADAFAKADHTWVTLQDKVVTGVFNSWFYIEETNRTSGIRVNATGVTEGQTVTVTGELVTVDGERALTNVSVGP